MGLFSKIFNTERKREIAQENVETFVTMVGVYNQASLAFHLGITNIKMLPELATYKRMMQIPTIGGKLGQAEKAHVKKFMITQYNLSDDFFKRMDAAIRKNCKGLKDVQSFFFVFGNFTNDLQTYLFTNHQLRLQGSMFFKSTLRSTLKKLINKMMTNNTWKDVEVAAKANKIRATAEALTLDSAWMTEFVFSFIMQSKKTKKKK